LSLAVNFSRAIFLFIMLGLDLFSGAYLNKFTVSMEPSDRIARGKGPTRLGASLPEDGNTASFQNQNVVLL
jgi:hypothetical protein